MGFASRRSWVAVLVVSMLGCSGAGGGGGGAAIDPPADLKAEQGGPFDAVRITWTEPPADVDGYELEGRMADGPWERMHEGLIERGVIGGWIQLDPTIPELTSFAFRIRSALVARRSDWSAEAAYLRGVRAPTALTAALAEGPAVDLGRTPRRSRTHCSSSAPTGTSSGRSARGRRCPWPSDRPATGTRRPTSSCTSGTGSGTGRASSGARRPERPQGRCRSSRPPRCRPRSSQTACA